MLYKAVCCFFGLLFSSAALAAERPNILWITSEDNGPELGCYGDTYADTPNIDRLASKGVRYRVCWSNAPVCAPARTTIITGMYATSVGGQHMRSMVSLPARVKLYPQYLRQAGYYCTNNSKEDYNVEKPGQVWDASNRRAHWKNRAAGQPFFAIFNIILSHESKIRKRPHQLVHDPKKVRIPAYHPDTPEVRHDWAQYYDVVTEMDAVVGQRLKELEKAGLENDTIVFYYGDHGSGMPRSKRWPYNSGLHVGLVVYIPEKFRDMAPADYVPNGESGRLVSFVDLAPTVLSLAGIKPPSFYQGHAFLGPFATEPQPYIYGFRGRMDERYDLVRSVRDRRYIYIRNYMPHKIYGQYINYMFQTPTTQVWNDLFLAGKLSPPKTFFWQRKPPEELYDLTNDRDEVNNLATSPAHQQVLDRLRQALDAQIMRIRDVGFLPEAELHHRAEGTNPYDMAHDDARYPLARILKAAKLASSMRPDVTQQLAHDLKDSDSAIRYWGAMGLLMRGREAVDSARQSLLDALKDPSANVRIAAAEALGRFGHNDDLDQSLTVLLDRANMQKQGVYSAIAALNAIGTLGPKAIPLRDKIAELPRKAEGLPRRLSSYVPRLLDELVGRLNP